MIKLDDNLLAELGLQSLPPEEKKNLLRHIYETLEMRVGTTLAQQMTDTQLDEFEGFINANDEAGALRWLETNFPNYKDVVAQEFEKLKAEVRQAAPQILASVQQMPQMPQMPVQQQQYDPAMMQQPQQYAQMPMPPQQPMPMMPPVGQPQQMPYPPQQPMPMPPQPQYYPQQPPQHVQSDFDQAA